jgi:polar amino acid transport system substrate-binding protein
MRLILVLAILLWGTVGYAAPPATIVLATADGAPLSLADGSGFHDRVLREAFARINIGMERVHVPAERALQNADAGVEAGVYVRVAGLEETYRNLVMVPEKVTEYEFVAFSKNRDLHIHDWEDLRSHEVGIITGWKILENNIRGSKSLLKVKNAELLFRALADDKVDLIVYNRLDGYGTLKEMGLSGIYVTEQPLAVRPMFLYLHKDHGQLTAPLAEALRAIKSDGTYEAIKREVLAPYLPE